jgi:uncharacterized protein
VTLAGLAIGVLPASAHVTVHSSDATGGGYAELTFRVPTEMDNASTTKLQVNLPTDTPLASVSVRPHPGWTFTLSHKTLSKPITTDDGKVTSVISAITWTAQRGQGIAPGEYDDFAVSAGPLPKSGTLRFPAIQTYSNGTVVRWIDVAAAGAPEPEHPAPSLSIDPAAAPSSTASMAGMDMSSNSSKSSSSTASLAIAVTALIIAVVAVGLGAIGLRRP